MDDKFLRRVQEAGYEISHDPAQDGNCFYWAAAFQLGIDWQILKNAVFEHLASNQFDVSCSCAVLHVVELYIQTVLVLWITSFFFFGINFISARRQ